MLQALPNFIGGFYQERSTNFAANRCINWYPILGSQDTKEVLGLTGIQGSTLLANLGMSPIRGIKVVGTTLFAVSGNTLYSVQSNGTSIPVGVLNTSSGPVNMAFNFANQLAIVDGLNLYIYNYSTNTFSVITTNVIGQPTTITFSDQYFIISFQNSAEFQISTPGDGTTWSALEIAVKEAYPDNLLAVFNLNHLLYLFGQETTEVWYDSGVGTMPFSTTSGLIQYGLESQQAVTQVTDKLCCLARNINGGRVALSIQGYSATVISTPALEQRWASYTTASDAYAMGMREEGSEFFVLTFPTAGETFVYDFSTKLWHERSSLINSNNAQWKMIGHEVLSTKHITGDVFTGNIYVLDPTVYTENGNPIVHRRVAPVIWKNRNNLIHRAFQIEFESGTALDIVSGPGSDPQAQLRWSDDGAHTWSNYHNAPLGRIGKYQQRTIWRQLGMSRGRNYDISISEPIKTFMIGVSADIEETSV